MKRKVAYDFETKQEIEWLKYSIGDLLDTKMFPRSKINNLAKHYNLTKPEAEKRAKELFLKIFEMMIVDLIENNHYFLFPRAGSCYLELHEYDREINFTDSPERIKFIIARTERMKRFNFRHPEFEPSKRMKNKIRELKKNSNHGW